MTRAYRGLRLLAAVRGVYEAAFPRGVAVVDLAPRVGGNGGAGGAARDAGEGASVTDAEKFARRFASLVKAAEGAGLRVCVDSDVPAIRVLTGEEYAREDLRGVGVPVRVSNACGGSDAMSTGNACSYGNL